MLLHINAEYKKAEVCLETISEIVGQDWRDGSTIKDACCTIMRTRIGSLLSM